MRKLLFKLIYIFSLRFFIQRKSKNRLYILMFHQINNNNRTFYQAIPSVVFEKICWFVNKYFCVINISEIEEHFKNTNKPAVIISFDDGHYDIIQNALPALKKYNLKFNVNIDTEILETKKPQDFVRVYDI